MTVLIDTSFTAVDGSPWPSPWQTGLVGGTVGGAIDIQSNRGRLRCHDGNYNVARASSDGVSAVDGVIEATIRFAEIQEQYLYLWARSGGWNASSPELRNTGYVLLLRTLPDLTGNEIAIYKHVPENSELVAVSDNNNVGTLSVNVDYGIKFSLDGSLLRVKLWDRAQSEPNWQVVTTDTSYTSGYFAISYLSGGTGGGQKVLFDSYKAESIETPTEIYPSNWTNYITRVTASIPAAQSMQLFTLTSSGLAPIVITRQTTPITLPEAGDVDATVHNHGSVSVSQSYALSFDGDRDKSDGAGYYTSVWSYGDHVYVGMNATNTANSQFLSDVARYSKTTGAELERVRLDTTGADTDDGRTGHSAVSLGIDGQGHIYGRRAGHGQHSGMQLRRTSSSGNLGTFQTVSEPSRPDGPWRDNYRRFFRSPDGSMWLWTRSYGTGHFPESRGLLWRYDASTNALVNVVGSGATPLQIRSETRTFNWHMTWTNSNVMWGISSVLASGTSGFPVASDATAGKSSDGGQTWSNLAGNSITLPFDHETGTSVFPNKHHRPIVVTGINNIPVFISPWSGPSNETDMSLWVRAYNPETNEFIGRRLDTAWASSREHTAIGMPDGGIVIGSRHPSNGRTQLYVTRPGPDWLNVWDRYELSTWNDGYVYFDPDCGTDNVIRVLVVEKDGQGAKLLDTNYNSNDESTNG